MAHKGDTLGFAGFKGELVADNEAKYGAEIREKYGDRAVDASNAKMMGMTEEEYLHTQELEKRYKELLVAAMEKGDPSCAEAQQACDLHREWLQMFWEDGLYSKDAHLGMGEMYVADERFRQNYDSVKPGMAAFFRDALQVYTAG